MITVEQILNATNGGLDIILSIYPQAKACIGQKNKHFAIRNERTPSACLRQYNSTKYGAIWQVTDFGGDGRGENAIDIFMRENGYDRSRFNEAILKLAAEYDVRDELNRSLNRPEIRQREARIDEQDGSRSFELNEKFTEAELKALGPKVTQKDVDALHWHSVKWISNVKDRKVTIKSSTENYPIFMRECVVEEATPNKPEKKFYKVYEPFNCDKGFRFSYTPAGAKPRYYINGLSELKKAYREFNSKEEKVWTAEHGDEKPYKEQKLPEAIICSGERDSLCCHSMGFHPLWFNSETYQLSTDEYKEIMKYVEVLYNIPDIDETGRRKGRELALRFIDIHTAWLPDKLQTYKDNRGKPRKDLRDWLEIHSERKDFRNLLKVAMPAKFWVQFLGKEGKLKTEIDTACLYNFLQLNGFYALHDENSAVTQFIRIEGNIVKRVNVKEIREFIRRWVVDRYEDRNILNLVLNTTKLSPAALESLQEIDLNFTNYTPDSQYFFFPNKTIEVCKPTEAHANGIKEYDPGADDLHNYVWEENVIQHRFKLLPDMFSISRTEDENGHGALDIEIHGVKSHFFGYLINTSRLYWREETETRFGEDHEASDSYIRTHPFCIEGEGLQPNEIAEQKKNLINKIFTFGYMLHRYKDYARVWAPLAMDNKIGEEDECNGRSGKSFFFKVLSFLMKTVKLSGRNPKLMDNPHVFDQVNQFTDLLLVDDCDRYLNLGLFYDNITSDMTVNPKNNRSFTISFEDAPKLAFTTNYVPQDFDPSSEARSLYMVFSDWYHQKTEDNDYRETRSIRDDFGKTLYAFDYTEEEWNADLNFWLQCCRVYLTLKDTGVKPQPPMGNMEKRHLKASMGANFEDWAEGYFSPEGGHLDDYIPRDEVFNEYQRFSNVSRITMQAFTKRLKAFCKLCPWIDSINPPELCNAGGRIQRTVQVTPEIRKTKDMVYIRSIPLDTKFATKTDATEQALAFENEDETPF